MHSVTSSTLVSPLLERHAKTNIFGNVNVLCWIMCLYILIFLKYLILLVWF